MNEREKNEFLNLMSKIKASTHIRGIRLQNYAFFSLYFTKVTTKTAAAANWN